MNRRENCPPCEGDAPEKRYPVCRVGLGLMLAGLALAFIGLAVGFWLTLVGAGLILIGYLVVSFC